MAVDATETVLARDAEKPSDLLVLLRSGWERGVSYRVRLTSSLLDTAGRGYLGSENIEWNVPHGTPDDAEPLVLFEQRFPMNYEGYLAAGDTVGWRFPGGQTNLFEGLWTDPVTGIAYARARWYDARNASWLSEDPIGDVDSPNLYAFVAWQPNMLMDPLGLAQSPEAQKRLREEGSRHAQAIMRGWPEKYRAAQRRWWERKRKVALFVDMWMEFRNLNTRSAMSAFKVVNNMLTDLSTRAAGRVPGVHEEVGAFLYPDDERQEREMFLIGVGMDLAVLRAAVRSGAFEASTPSRTTTPKINLADPRPSVPAYLSVPRGRGLSWTAARSADDLLQGATQVRGRFPETAGANEVLLRRGADGAVTHYQVYDANGLPVLRVDLIGRPHGGIPTPHVVEYVHNLNPTTGEVFPRPGPVRAALPEEIPGS
ncbi:MAG: hypothetical protein GY835_02855 [bacterium]|nr:hypothetical protein [bacterium]